MEVRVSILIGLLVAGCGKGGEITIGVPPKAKPTDQNTTKPTPAKELTLEEQKALREKVVGEYERLKKTPTGFIIDKYIFLENGIVELYYNGEKEEEEVKWKISKEGEIHNVYKDGFTTVYRMNPDGGLTFIAGTGKDGEREDIPKGYQSTAKKIK